MGSRGRLNPLAMAVPGALMPAALYLAFPGRNLSEISLFVLHLLRRVTFLARTTGPQAFSGLPMRLKSRSSG